MKRTLLGVAALTAAALVSAIACAQDTAQQAVSALCADNGAGLMKIVAWVGGTMGVAGLLSNFKNKLSPPIAALLQLASGQAIHALELWARRSAPVILLAAVLGLAACGTTTTTTNGVTTVTVSNGWTADAAGNVEYAEGTAIALQLGRLEAELPDQKAAIQAAGQALLKGVTAQVTDMQQGSSAIVQTKDAAISAIVSVAPNLSGIVSAVEAKLGAINPLSDLVAFLANEAIYVGPAVLKANAGTTTPADVATSLAAFQAAVAKL